MGDAISVIIPAYNEEHYLPHTLEHVQRAIDDVVADREAQVEIVVVDNASTDRTAEIAIVSGARVVNEPEHNIARVRNAGALAASGDLLVFVDADTLIPGTLLSRIAGLMDDLDCHGGAVETDYRPMKPAIRVYLGFWRVIGLMWGMAQGATQFCRRDAFAALGGYDEKIYMGEDVDFYWRLGRFAKSRGGRTEFVKDLRVVPSCRRYDQWSVARTLIWTNPLVCMLLCRRRASWTGWYDDVPR